jgi:hypothetical protein
MLPRIFFSLEIAIAGSLYVNPALLLLRGELGVFIF